MIRSNVLDQLRYNYFKCTGNDKIYTSNVDAESRRFGPDDRSVRNSKARQTMPPLAGTS